MILRNSGYEVLTAQDGASAVSTVRRDRPDLVLLDLSFPPDVAHGGGVAWDGFLILNWLRRMDEAVHTPIMIITAADPAKSRQRCLAAGVVNFFQKPINNQELLAAIRQILEPNSAEEPRPSDAPAAKKILFIDDENDWRFMAGVYLQDAGFEVLMAKDTAEALEQAQAVKPDLIILDLNLAGESGLSLLKPLKERHPQIPILLYTGMDHEPPAIEAMLHQGADRYLRKGTMGEMLQTVQEAIAAHG